MFDIPVLYIIFNRPAETAASFEVLRKQKPRKLFIAADGPRNGNPADAANCKAVREIVSQKVDWDCEVKTLFRNENLGCRNAVEGALEWFFSKVDMGIILEDDIIPNQGFFTFCEILLNRYKNDTDVFSINGCSLGYQNPKVPYGRTNYFNMWGWATWRRSFEMVKPTWSQFEPQTFLASEVTVKKNLHLPVLFGGNQLWLEYWKNLFKAVYENKIDTWDYQWCYTVLKTDKYCIRPSENYIVNIGNGEQATHHKFTEAPIFNFKYTADDYLDKEPKPVKIDFDYELYHVAAIVNSFYFKSFRKRYLSSYLKFKVENLKSKFRK